MTLKNKFIRNTLSLFSGTMAGQFLIIISSPLLTRIYTLEQFGYLAIFTSFLSIFINALSLRYEMAFINIAEKKTKLALLKFIIILIFASSTFIVLLFITLELLGVIKYFNSLNIYILLWVSLIGIGMYNSLQHYAVSESEIRNVSLSKFQQAISLVFIQLASGFLNIKNGLILGDSISRISGILIFLKNIKISEYKEMISAPKKEILIVLKKYQDYAKFSVISGITNNFVMQSLPLVLAIFYSQPLIGLLTIIQRVLVVPIKLISQSIKQSFLNEIMVYIHDENYKSLEKLIIKIVTILTIISIPPLILGILFGEKLLVFALGQSLLGSAEIINILLLLSVFQFIFIPVSQTLEFIEKQRVQFRWQVIRFFVILIALFTTPYLGLSFNMTLSIYVIIMNVFYVLLFIMIIVVLRKINNCKKGLNNENTK